MESEDFQLRGENAQLKERLSALARSAPRDFVEARGVLFKRTDGGFEPDPIAPIASGHFHSMKSDGFVASAASLPRLTGAPLRQLSLR
jgi:hypothetical protein